MVLTAPESDHIQRIIATTGKPYELDLLRDIKLRLKPNSAVIDIGANIGNHTLFFAAACKAKVYSFEPNPELCTALRQSIALNNLDGNVKLHQVGIGAEEGEGNLVVIDPRNIGRSKMQSGRGIAISRIDSFSFAEKITLVKVDVEGMELDVLRGAEATILRDKPLIYVEAGTRVEYDAVLEWLKARGYSYWDTYCKTPTHLFVPDQTTGLRTVSERTFQTKDIGIVIRSLAGRSGGAEKVYCDLANKLSRAGYRVTCYHFDRKRDELFFPLSSSVKRVNLLNSKLKLGLYWFIRMLASVRHLRIQRGRLRWLERHFLFSKLLVKRLKRNKHDLVIGFMPFGNAPALLAARETGVPVIATNHSVPKIDYTRRWDNKLSYCRSRQLELLKEAAAVQVLFPRYGSFFESSIQDRVVAIPNYVDLQGALVPEAREKVILAVGRFVPLKNYKILADAWLLIHERHPHWSVRIVGEGPQKSEVAELLRRSPAAAERFTFVGLTNDVRDEYLKASVFCHPALFEGFGLAPAEALKMGLPVVAFSDCAGLQEYVRHDENGLLIDRATQANGLAEALDRIIVDDALRYRLSAAAPRSVEAFSEAEFMRRWIELIERVTG